MFNYKDYVWSRIGNSENELGIKFLRNEGEWFGEFVGWCYEF